MLTGLYSSTHILYMSELNPSLDNDDPDAECAYFLPQSLVMFYCSYFSSVLNISLETESNAV